MGHDPSSADLVFTSCVFSFIPNRALAQEAINEYIEQIQKNGGTISPLNSDGSIRLNGLTHVISATADFAQYNEVCDRLIPVIAPTWIASSLLKNKQLPVRGYSPDPRLIFSGVNVTCADLPSGDKNAIAGAVMAMGGIESSSLTKQTTHIVALTEDHQKCIQAREKGLKVKVVLPHWFDDCLRLGKRINEMPYLLPNPDVLRISATEAIRAPPSAHIEGASTARPDFSLASVDVSTNSSTSSRRLTVFQAKVVMLAEDLKIGSRLRDILEELIVKGGGSITTAIQDADMYVCGYRQGRDYVYATRAGKDVGNLAWLYFLITHNEWTSPMRRLLHYPVPAVPISGFENLKITLSNYSGEARVYLENLVVAAGAEFTKSMKQDNTHLITAHDNSEKCNAAREWNIHMINHLWIEESYAKCEMQSLTNTRYTHFPSRTNLGEVIGQTQFDKVALKRLYYSDVVQEPTPKSARFSADHSNATHDLDSLNTTKHLESAEKASMNSSLMTPRSALGVPNATRNGLLFCSPGPRRIVGSGKENQTPSSTSSRTAKDLALSRLHDLAPDLALYEKEKKRSGRRLWGGKRAADSIDCDTVAQRSPSPTIANGIDGATADHPKKRPKINGRPLPEIHTRLLVTRYTPWENALVREQNDKRRLRELGILIDNDPTSCTLIAAPAIVRTKKFLVGLAHGVPVISSRFVDTCLADNRIPALDKFSLRDPENEKRFGICFRDTLRRAKANPRKLLAGVTVYCTESIPHGFELFKSIIEANGGECGLYRGRPGGLVRRNVSGIDEEPESVYLVTGTTYDESLLWSKFEEMATESGFRPKVVRTEWLLDAALRQELLWKPAYLAAIL